jgi:DNA-binding NarL/FixJ family response regulator
MSSVAIILADDHAVVRHGLRSLVEREHSYTVVGEAADGPAAIELVARLSPDVLVVDLQMPGMSGLEVIRQVRQGGPPPQVLVLSMHADALYVREALRAGATGYVLKQAPAAEFLQAVREVAHGRRYLSRALVEDLFDTYLDQVGAGVDDPYELLTDSERAVLKLAALGLTSAAIADQLALSPRTVETYRTNLLHKLDLRNQTDLVRYAIKRGIIPLE